MNSMSNIWVPRNQSHRRMTNEEVEIDKYYRTIRSILNKMTPQKFKKLLNALMSLDIDSEFKMEKLAEFVIEKAICEPLFGEVYARMCAYLINHMKEKNSKKSSDCFKRFLIDGCENYFQKIFEYQLRETNKNEDWHEEFINRQHMFGTVKFIGELYKTEVISESVTHGYIIKLLTNLHHLELQLECSCKLLRTTGQQMEKVKLKKDQMDVYFAQINQLNNKHVFCSRVRFAVLDLCELRNNNWNDRTTREVPTTIDQIRSQHDNDDEDKEDVGTMLMLLSTAETNRR